MAELKFELSEVVSSLIYRYPKGEDGKPNYAVHPERVELRTLNFIPSDDGSEENRVFWDALPNGKLELGTVNPEGWNGFDLGGEYYLRIVPVD